MIPLFTFPDKKTATNKSDKCWMSDFTLFCLVTREVRLIFCPADGGIGAISQFASSCLDFRPVPTTTVPILSIRTVYVLSVASSMHTIRTRSITELQ
jgi:hypothetical protein